MEKTALAKQGIRSNDTGRPAYDLVIIGAGISGLSTGLMWLKNTQGKKTLIVEKNPTPLSCAFMIPAGTGADVQTRLKMGQSTNVIAVVKADGKLYSATKETKVTLGGCGG